MASESITDQELRDLLVALEVAAKAWVKGDAAPYITLSSVSADYTIFGPFGGPPIKGFDVYNQRAALAARAFANGDARIEVVQAHKAGDLLVLILIEHQTAQLAGGQMQDWILRVTQVHRREAGGWKIVHRHADPLAQQRSVQQTAAIARGE